MISRNIVRRIAKSIVADISDAGVESVGRELAQLELPGYEDFRKQAVMKGAEWLAKPKPDMRGYPELYVRMGSKGGMVTGYRFVEIDPDGDGEFNDDMELENYRGPLQRTMSGLLEEISILMERLNDYMADKAFEKPRQDAGGGEGGEEDSGDEGGEEDSGDEGGEDEGGDLDWMK